jgi:hypothetical protein
VRCHFHPIVFSSTAYLPHCTFGTTVDKDTHGPLLVTSRSDWQPVLGVSYSSQTFPKRELIIRPGDYGTSQTGDYFLLSFDRFPHPATRYGIRRDLSFTGGLPHLKSSSRLFLRGRLAIRTECDIAFPRRLDCLVERRLFSFPRSLSLRVLRVLDDKPERNVCTILLFPTLSCLSSAPYIVRSPCPVGDIDEYADAVQLLTSVLR